MTLPTNYKLPELNKDQSPEQTTSYLQDLTYELQNMYETTAQNVNGVIRNSEDVDGSEWIPTLNGSTTKGTFTYSQRMGWVIRTGIITEVSFDIYWTDAGTATGLLYVELPYKVTKSLLLPFFGAALSNTVAFGAGYTQIGTSALPSTFKGVFTLTGTGVISTFLQVQGSGRVAGQLRYIGVEDE
jgi:hypothetical protein